MKGLLQGAIAPTEPKPFLLAKSMYQSCMDTEKIEEKGLTPLTDVLKRMGGWPLLEGDSWDKDKFKWFEMVYRFRDEGFSIDYLINFSVTTDLRNSSWRTLDLDQPGLGMSREHLMRGMEDKNIQVCNNV